MPLSFLPPSFLSLCSPLHSSLSVPPFIPLSLFPPSFLSLCSSLHSSLSVPPFIPLSLCSSLHSSLSVPPFIPLSLLFSSRPSLSLLLTSLLSLSAPHFTPLSLCSSLHSSLSLLLNSLLSLSLSLLLTSLFSLSLLLPSLLSHFSLSLCFSSPHFSLYSSFLQPLTFYSFLSLFIFPSVTNSSPYPPSFSPPFPSITHSPSSCQLSALFLLFHFFPVPCHWGGGT